MLIMRHRSPRLGRWNESKQSDQIALTLISACFWAVLTAARFRSILMPEHEWCFSFFFGWTLDFNFLSVQSILSWNSITWRFGFGLFLFLLRLLLNFFFFITYQTSSPKRQKRLSSNQTFKLGLNFVTMWFDIQIASTPSWPSKHRDRNPSQTFSHRQICACSHRKSFRSPGSIQRHTPSMVWNWKLWLWPRRRRWWWSAAAHRHTTLSFTSCITGR